ncbi:MAG: PKD domain-containing protein [Calditrichaeota bacterium]|nr:PKD domain-containing protein [Calditrichota bacterium]
MRSLGHLSVLALLLISALNGLAETRVTGPVRGQWTVAQSPYIVIGNVSVGANETLTIEPGVVVRFAGNFRFDVSGVLQAIGTVNDSIRFFSDSGQPGAWRAIYITGALTDGTILRYVTLAHAYRGVEATDANPRIANSRFYGCQNAGIRSVRSRPQIADCLISNITDNGNGIAATERSIATITNSTIFNCTRFGIGADENSVVNVSNCFIDNTTDAGIYLNAAPNSVIERTVIANARTRAFSVWQSNAVRMERCVAYQATGPGFYLYNSQSLNLLNNTSLSNGQYGILLASGSTATLTNNLVVQNRMSGILNDRSQALLRYNDFWANNRDYDGIEAGANDISADPRLVDPAHFDFRPGEGSDVIDAGDPATGYDPDGTRRDIGAGFFNQNRPPRLTDWEPDTLISVSGDSLITFSVTAEDDDGDALRYYWYLNGGAVGNNRTFQRAFPQDGAFVVRVVVDDNLYEGRTDHTWSFSVIGAAAPRAELPADWSVSPAFPNPFNNATRIDYTLPFAGSGFVTLVDLTGREVHRAELHHQSAGSHTLVFPGSRLPSGLYSLSLRLGPLYHQQTLIHLK